VSDNDAQILCGIRRRIKVKDRGSVCEEVVLARKVEVGRWEVLILADREGNLERESGKEGENVGVVGGNAGSIIQGGNGADGGRCGRRSVAGAGIVLGYLSAKPSKYAGVWPTNLNAPADDDFFEDERRVRRGQGSWGHWLACLGQVA
jgi:hypothetical protein